MKANYPKKKDNLIRTPGKNIVIGEVVKVNGDFMIRISRKRHGRNDTELLTIREFLKMALKSISNYEEICEELLKKIG